MNNLLTKLLIREKKRIGVEVGDDYISIVVNHSPFGKTKIYSSHHILCGEIFNHDDENNAQLVLDKLFDKSITEDLKSIKNKINVVLPDSLFVLYMMVFDQLPEKTSDLNALVEWRFRRELKIDDARAFIIEYEKLGFKDKKYRLLVSAIEKKNLDVINDLFADYQDSVCTIKPYAINLHNYMENKYSHFQKSMGIIAIYKTYWSLELVDNDFQISVIRIQRHNSSTESAQHISQEVERIIRSYLYESSSHSIEDIILVGHCSLSEQVKDNLDYKLNKKIIKDTLPMQDIKQEYYPIVQAAVIAAKQV